MTTTASGVPCPKCGAPDMWDNREGKRNPKAPDFKCRDKSCDGVIWPPKNGAAPARAAAPAPAAKQGYSNPPYIAAIDGEHPALPHEKLDGIFRVYDVCLDHAYAKAEQKFGKDVADDTVAAMTSTLMIAAERAGIV